jgi:outer membrane immunogenic protein
MTRLLITTAMIAVSAVTFVASASAADLGGRRAPQPAFQSQASPSFTWTGFYLGANAGAIWGDFTKGGKFIDTKTGFTGGITAGYNQQFGQFVAGIEGDYNYSGMGGRGLGVPGLIPVKGDLTSFGTVRGRLGVAFDRALIYGTGGFAMGSTTLQSGFAKSSSTNSGYVIGAGLEYAFTQNISAKAEYLYMPLGGRNLVGVPGFNNGAKTGVDANVLRAGLNYKF